MKRLVDSKPENIKDNHFVDDLYEKIKADPNPRKTRRSIQISDLHIDFAYKEGAANECNFPICCRDNGPGLVEALDSPTVGKAGRWGDYKCDIPTVTLASMFDFIANNQDTLKTDFITWCGDNSGHNVWDNTNEEVTKYSAVITDMLNKALGPESEITVFPSLGNHDVWPVNVQDFSKPNSNYPINHLVPVWTGENWLSAEEAEVFGRYGYFSKPFPFNPKGTVISLNSQSCNDMNWWLFSNRQDPGQQIEWLEGELARIEKEGGFVHIIGHIQP